MTVLALVTVVLSLRLQRSRNAASRLVAGAPAAVSREAAQDAAVCAPSSAG